VRKKFCSPRSNPEYYHHSFDFFSHVPHMWGFEK
jgi:hypothetical protein